MSDTPADLHQQVEEFGRETAGLLSATLPNLPVPPVRILVRENRSIIQPADGRSLPLYAGGQHLADMKISIACELDSSGQWLAVEESTYNLLALLDRTPVLRIHYRRNQGARPSAHVHVHGHRGALSHLLSQAGHDSPHDMSFLAEDASLRKALAGQARAGVRVRLLLGDPDGTGVTCEITGLSGVYSDPRHVIHYTSNDEVRREFSIVLTARPVTGQPTPSAESREVRWVDPADLASYAMDRSMRRRVDDYQRNAGAPVIA